MLLQNLERFKADLTPNGKGLINNLHKGYDLSIESRQNCGRSISPGMQPEQFSQADSGKMLPSKLIAGFEYTTEGQGATAGDIGHLCKNEAWR